MRLTIAVPTAADAKHLRLNHADADVDVVEWDLVSPPPRSRFDIVVVPYLSPTAVLRRLDGVEVSLVQGQSIGYEDVGASLPRGLRFANAEGVHEVSTAELAVTLALAAQRSIPEFVRAQDEARWSARFTRSLADQRVTLLGFGGVGKRIAARLSGFEAPIRAVASRARTEDGIVVETTEKLHAVLAETDVVIASLPGGPPTRHVLDDAAFAALPDGALVVNVGRGSLVDTDALVAHLSRRRLRAALDVVDPEPLPLDHPLWSMPGVLLTPHVGGASTAMAPRMRQLIGTQIRQMLRGEAPLNLVTIQYGA